MSSDEDDFISAGDAAPPDEAEAAFKKALELTGEKWLTHSQIVELLTARGSMSVGAADAIVDTLRAASFANKPTGVRWQWFHDTDFRTTNKPNRGNTWASEADVNYWLNQKFPNNTDTGNRRYADEVLIAEALKGIDSGIYGNAHKAAQALAPRAEGNIDAAIDRLGRKIRARQKSRKSPKTPTMH